MSVSLPLASSDGISNMQFSKFQSSPNMLLVSSWDSSLIVYDTEILQPMISHKTVAPILATTFGVSPSEFFFGGLEGKIKTVGLEAELSKQVGCHSGPVSCLAFNKSHNRIISGSWDKKIGFWDSRENVGSGNKMELPGKVFSIDSEGDYIITATSGRCFRVYDHRKLTTDAVINIPSPLKCQVRRVKLKPSCSRFIATSVEGRVAEASIKDENDRFTFKCHRKEKQIYPVNCLSIHPKHNTFVTGGGDGTVVCWDPEHKKKLSTIGRYDTSIAGVDFNLEGNKLAIAISYTFERGELFQIPLPQLIIRTIKDKEVMQKTKNLGLAI